MMTGLVTMEPSDRIPRHEHRVRDFSRNYALTVGPGDGYGVEADIAERLVRLVTTRFDVPAPDLAFNARRRPDTGACWPPRWRVVASNGEGRVDAWERHHGRAYPVDGRIRLGRVTTLRTLGHELGHHLVHCLDPVRTPAHGKVWVGRFDDAMEIIAAAVSVPSYR